MKKNPRKPSTHGGKRKGAGRPKGTTKPNALVKYAVAIPPEMPQRIDNFQRKQQLRSRNAAMVRLLEDGLNANES